MAVGRCVVCGADLVQTRPYAFKSAVFPAVYTDRMVYRCRDCGLQQCDHQRIDAVKLEEYYRSQYRSTAHIGQNELGAETPWFVARAKALAGLASAHQGDLSVRRVFEIGAGYGANLLAMKDVFPAAELLTDEIDASLSLPAGIGRGALSDGGYDVLILSHVLEHFIDPVSVLRRCCAALNRHGLLIIEVPNSPQVAIHRGGFDEPHVSFFSEDTLRQAVGQVEGLSLLQCYTCGPLLRQSLLTQARVLVRMGLEKMPFVLRWIRKLKHGIVPPPTAFDFTAPQPGGVFLRAAYRKA